MQAGAQAIKIEGANHDICKTIEYVVQSGVPIMGHIGLTPQSVHQLGGYVVQGRAEEQITKLLHQAEQLERAGCFAIVLECVPGVVGKYITDSLTIPTIGIGAGTDTDGQILVWHDMLGLQTEFKPRFVEYFVQGKQFLATGIDAYVRAVQNAHFPAIEHIFE